MRWKTRTDVQTNEHRKSITLSGTRRVDSGPKNKSGAHASRICWICHPDAAPGAILKPAGCVTLFRVRDPSEALRAVRNWMSRPFFVGLLQRTNMKRRLAVGVAGLRARRALRRPGLQGPSLMARL
jgi:hypothetical protein